MSYTYATYTTALAELMVVPTDDPDFVAIQPSIIDYAEGRLLRELDLLATIVRDSSATVTPGTRTFTLPTTLGRFVVVNGINIITPAAQTVPDAGTRNPLTPVSRDYIERAWPNVGGATVPTVFAMLTDQIVLVGPVPDNTYTAEVVGTIRPTPLSSGNTTTFLSLYLPDLFMAASMIFACGYQHNFGRQSDDPQAAVSWETQYGKLMASAQLEELRKRFAGAAWSSLSAGAPPAQPARN